MTANTTYVCKQRQKCICHKKKVECLNLNYSGNEFACIISKVTTTEKDMRYTIKFHNRLIFPIYITHEIMVWEL